MLKAYDVPPPLTMASRVGSAIAPAEQRATADPSGAGPRIVSGFVMCTKPV
jgi:hypothetical protein